MILTVSKWQCIYWWMEQMRRNYKHILMGTNKAGPVWLNEPVRSEEFAVAQNLFSNRFLNFCEMCFWIPQKLSFCCFLKCFGSHTAGVQQEFGARFFAEQFLVLWCIPKSTAHFPYSKTYVGGRLHFQTPKTSWSNSILLESHQLRPWRLDFWILFQQALGPCKASRWPEAPDVRIEFSAEFRVGSSACGKCGASWEVGRHAIRMWR